MANACCTIKIRDLKHEINLQSKSNVRKSGGGYTTTWSTYATEFAMLVPRKASEFVRAMKGEAYTTFEITIRYRTDIEVGHRIKYGSRYFHINGIVNIDEASKFSLMQCIENDEAAA